MTDTRSARDAGWGPRDAFWDLTPTQITGIYIAVGASALYASNVLLPSIVPSQPLLERLQFAKAVVEVAVTAGFIYLLTAQNGGALHEANEHLAAARRELSVLHRIFRHNLRNDITIVAGHAETLEGEVDRPQLEDHCDAIQRSCEDLLTCTEKAKLVADLNRNGVETTDVDLAETLDSVANRFDPLPPNVEFDVADPDESVVIAHEYIEFAITEFVENAFVHNDASTPAVSIDVDDAPECVGWIHVCIEDNGPGIPEEELDTLDAVEQPLRHGSGVGLWVARWIVLQSGGDFRIENTADGCRVTIGLPTPETPSAHGTETALRRFLA